MRLGAVRVRGQWPVDDSRTRFSRAYSGWSHRFILVHEKPKLWEGCSEGRKFRQVV